MRRFGLPVALLLVLYPVAAGAGHAAPRNLLTNAGFEESVPRSEGGVPRVAGWQFQVFTPPDIEIALDQTTRHCGEHAVRISAPVPRPGLSAAVTQEVRAVKPCASYKLSGWVLLRDVHVGYQKGAARIQLSFCDRDGRCLGLREGCTRATDGWQQLSVTGTAPEGSAYISVRCVFGGGNTDGSLWFDDLLLAEIGTQ